MTSKKFFCPKGYKTSRFDVWRRFDMGTFIFEAKKFFDFMTPSALQDFWEFAHIEEKKIQFEQMFLILWTFACVNQRRMYGNQLEICSRLYRFVSVLFILVHSGHSHSFATPCTVGKLRPFSGNKSHRWRRVMKFGMIVCRAIIRFWKKFQIIWVTASLMSNGLIYVFQKFTY